jgi:ATP-binding cassette subfamily C (CFTR/MRP) protein 1
VEQGSFQKLNENGGYVASFDLPPPDWDFAPEKHLYEAPPKYTEKVDSSKLTEEDIQAEANRRTGDTAIYLYYVQTVGWIPTIVFIVSITIFIFGQSFPSKYLLAFKILFHLSLFIFHRFVPSAFLTDADSLHLALWVKWWASFNAEYPNQQLGKWLGVYAMLGAVALIFLIISCW